MLLSGSKTFNPCLLLCTQHLPLVTAPLNYSQLLATTPGIAQASILFIVRALAPPPRGGGGAPRVQTGRILYRISRVDYQHCESVPARVRRATGPPPGVAGFGAAPPRERQPISAYQRRTYGISPRHCSPATLGCISAHALRGSGVRARARRSYNDHDTGAWSNRQDAALLMQTVKVRILPPQPIKFSGDRGQGSE